MGPIGNDLIFGVLWKVLFLGSVQLPSPSSDV